MITSWRLADTDGAGYPASFEDVACAVGVARAIGSAHGGDPERVVLVGYSLDGWLATVPGVPTSSPVRKTAATTSRRSWAGIRPPESIVVRHGRGSVVMAPYAGPMRRGLMMSGDQPQRFERSR